MTKKQVKINSAKSRMPDETILSNPWVPYVGDCKALDTFLNSKQGVGWLFPKYINALLRGISQVLFANNPLTGLIILLSLFWADPIVGCATLLAAVVALITSFAFMQDTSSIYNGLTTYNAVLVGSVTSSLWTPIYNEPLSLKIWIFIVLGSIMSVFITTALANFFGSFKVPLPCLTLPFNIVALLLFTILMPPLPTPGTSTPGGMSIVNETNGSPTAEALITPAVRTTRQAEAIGDLALEVLDEMGLGTGNDSTKMPLKAGELHWGHMLSGIIVSGGQVYAVENLISSILIFISLIIYSPILCCMAILGSILGSISGLLFAPAHTVLYSGLWGFNGILSSAAVGGFFIAMTCHSFFLAVANVLFTVAVQQALALAFGPLRLPVFTLPFCLSTFIFLLFTSTGNYLPRVKNISFPEMHRMEHLIAMEEEKKALASTADEKELVLKEIKVIDEATKAEEEKKVENGSEEKKVEEETKE